MILKNKNGRIDKNPSKGFFIKFVFIKYAGFLVLASLILISIYWGSKNIQTKGYNGLFDFITTIGSNYWNARNAHPDNISIEIKDKDLKKLEKHRENALERNVIINELDGEYVPATLEYQNKKIKIKLRLKGHMTDHLQDNKWSFRIKVKDENAFLGMKRFSIQHPGTRGYIYEWIYHELMKQESIIALKYKFMNVTLNGKDWGIYAVEENFDEELIANNNRVKGPVIRFNPDLYWVDRLNELKGSKPISEFASYSAANIEAYRENKMIEDSTQLKYFLKAMACVETLRNKKGSVDQVFDIERLAKFHAIIDLVGGQESIDWSDIKYYFNPVSNRLEPVAYESFTSFPVTKLSGMYQYVQLDSSTYYKDWHSTLFSNPVFFKAYIKALERIASPAYLDAFFSERKKELSQNLAILNKEFPYKKFDVSDYYKNQLMITKMMNAAKPFHAYFEKAEGNHVYLQLGAIESLPTEIKSVQLGKLVWTPVTPLILPAKQINAYVDYKEYVFEGSPLMQYKSSLVGMKINYSLLGASTEKQADVFPYPHVDATYINEELTTKKSTITNFPFLIVDEVNKLIHIEKGMHEILFNMVIPAGYKIVASSGTTLNLKNKAKIISYAPALFMGTEDNPIIITSSDFTGQGIEFINAPGSKFNCVAFGNMKALDNKPGENKGAFTFYESNVTFKDCNFSNIRQEDALHLIRSDYAINNCLFQNIHLTGVRALFSKGTISNSVFENCNAAAIEATMGMMNLNTITVSNTIKGLNIKERAQVKGRDLRIKKATVALCAEDGGTIELSNTRIVNSGTAITAKNRTNEYAAVVKMTGLSMAEVKRNYLLEHNSRIIVDEVEMKDDGKTQTNNGN